MVVAFSGIAEHAGVLGKDFLSLLARFACAFGGESWAAQYFGDLSAFAAFGEAVRLALLERERRRTTIVDRDRFTVILPLKA
jgi:hypothetical protein